MFCYFHPFLRLFAFPKHLLYIIILKKYVGEVLDGQKFQTARVSASWRKSEAVEYVGNVFELPEDYIKYSDPTVDKTALKKALKNGEEIEGARLVIRQNLQIK